MDNEQTGGDITVLAIVINVIKQFNFILMPKLLVDQLEKRALISEFLFVIGGMGIIIVFTESIRIHRNTKEKKGIKTNTCPNSTKEAESGQVIRKLAQYVRQFVF